VSRLIPHDDRIFGLPVYDRMRQAIVQAYRVDEVADIRDRALACETYAKLAKDPQNERLACDIRLRAERRAGQLLREMEKAKGARLNGRDPGGAFRQSPDTTAEKTLADLGISKDQSSKWQQLAAVPKDEFEAALAGPDKPTTTGILKQRDATRDRRGVTNHAPLSHHGRTDPAADAGQGQGRRQRLARRWRHRRRFRATRQPRGLLRRRSGRI
jgi:hypothetical protein